MKTLIAVVLMSFKTLRDGLLSTFANNVVLKMTDNENFTTVADKLKDVSEAVTDYDKQLSKAEKGTRADIAKKNVSKKALIKALTELAGKINSEKKGDREALLTTGYDVSKADRTLQTLEPIKKLALTYGHDTGQIILKVLKGKGTKGTTVFYTTDQTITAATVWIPIPLTADTCTINDLTPGQYVQVKVLTVGSRNQNITSSVVKKMVA